MLPCISFSLQYIFAFIHYLYFIIHTAGGGVRRGHDRMVVVSLTTYAISVYHH